MTRFFRIDGRFHSNDPVHIFVKGEFKEGWNDDTDKAIALAEKAHGLFENIQS